jgi:hypothetical protein
MMYHGFQKQFRLLSNMLRKTAVREFRKADDITLRRAIVEQALHMRDRVMFETLLLEHAHAECGMPTFFVEESILIDKLAQARFEIHGSGILLPADVVEFAFPEPIGAEIGGCMVAIIDFDMRKKHTDAMTKALGLPGVKRVVREGGSKDEKYLAMAMTHAGQLLLVEIPLAQVTDALNEGWLESLPLAGAIFSCDTSDADLQRRMLAIVTRLLVYVDAFPGQVRSGIPDRCCANGVNVGRCQASTILTESKLHTSPCAHFRSGFTRTLRDQRYGRNPDGSFREVQVRATTVNWGDDHTTVTGEGEQA